METEFRLDYCIHCGEREWLHSANNDHCFKDYEAEFEDRELLATVYSPNYISEAPTIAQQVVETGTEFAARHLANPPGSGRGEQIADPSPWFIREDERKAVRDAIESQIGYYDMSLWKGDGFIDPRPTLNAILDRFQDPKNQGAA